jgi:hypothetical protein
MTSIDHTPAPHHLAKWETKHWLQASRQLMNQKPAVLLEALRDFANTGDTPDEVLTFLRRHPGLMGFPYCDPTVGEQTLHFVQGIKEWARSPEESKTYQDMFVQQSFFRFRDRLRKVWSGGDTNGVILAELLSLFDQPETNELEDPERLIRLRCRILPDWRRGSLQYRPRHAFERACYLLLENSTRVKFCARAECSSPYFIAARVSQRYCGTDCAEAMQEEWKKKWWREKGNHWRRRKKGVGLSKSIRQNKPPSKGA